MPYSRPPSPPSREAQKASATAGGAPRTSNEPCSASAIPSTTRRARDSSVAGSSSSSCAFSRSHVRVQARVGALGQGDLGEEHLERARRARERAQHVEADHVARALPDRGQRRLAVQARHPRVLDVAVAAEALHRLERVVRRALAGPVLADRGRDALEQLRVAVVVAFARVVPGFVVGAREAHRERRRGLGLQAEVGEHVAHQGLVDERLAERGAVRGVVGGLHDRGAHPGGGADHAVQARVADHLDDRRHAAAGLADHLRPGVVQLDLRGGVRAVAELVLEALDVHRVARPVGEDARHQKAGQALGGAVGGLGLGEHEEQVGHRRRAEPLVAGELVLARPAPPPFSGRAKVVFARTSEPPCFSVIAIPAIAEPFSAAGIERGS